MMVTQADLGRARVIVDGVFDAALALREPGECFHLDYTSEGERLLVEAFAAVVAQVRQLGEERDTAQRELAEVRALLAEWRACQSCGHTAHRGSRGCLRLECACYVDTAEAGRP